MEKAIDQEIESKKSEGGNNAGYELIDLDEDTIRVRSHTDLDPSYVGHVESLSTESCVVLMKTSKLMNADSQALVHSGFIGSAAEYTALVVVNDPNGMIFSVNSQYFACARVGDEVKFTAKVKHTDNRKREVDVIGKIDAIKIYEAKMIIVVPEYHPLKIQLLDVAGAK